MGEIYLASLTTEDLRARISDCNEMLADIAAGRDKTSSKTYWINQRTAALLELQARQDAEAKKRRA